MIRKFFGFLLAITVFFSLSSAKIGMSGSMPEAGDAVYRDIDTSITSIKLVGHAGIYIGNFEVIHMQYPRIAKGNLVSTFYADYWGSFYAGDSKAPKKIVEEANNLLNKKVAYSFLGYKNFDLSKLSPLQAHGRCDGLVEFCYEKAGNDIVPNDNGWTKLSPQLQWKSSKPVNRFTSARGKTAKDSALIAVNKNLEKLL